MILDAAFWQQDTWGLNDELIGQIMDMNDMELRASFRTKFINTDGHETTGLRCFLSRSENMIDAYFVYFSALLSATTYASDENFRDFLTLQTYAAEHPDIFKEILSEKLEKIKKIIKRTPEELNEIIKNRLHELNEISAYAKQKAKKMTEAIFFPMDFPEPSFETELKLFNKKEKEVSDFSPKTLTNEIRKKILKKHIYEKEDITTEVDLNDIPAISFSNNGLPLFDRKKILFFLFHMKPEIISSYAFGLINEIKTSHFFELMSVPHINQYINLDAISNFILENAEKVKADFILDFFNISQAEKKFFYIYQTKNQVEKHKILLNFDLKNIESLNIKNLKLLEIFYSKSNDKDEKNEIKKIVKNYFNLILHSWISDYSANRPDVVFVFIEALKMLFSCQEVWGEVELAKNTIQFLQRCYSPSEKKEEAEITKRQIKEIGNSFKSRFKPDNLLNIIANNKQLCFVLACYLCSISKEGSHDLKKSYSFFVALRHHENSMFKKMLIQIVMRCANKTQGTLGEALVDDCSSPLTFKSASRREITRSTSELEAYNPNALLPNPWEAFPEWISDIPEFTRSESTCSLNSFDSSKSSEYKSPGSMGFLSPKIRSYSSLTDGEETPGKSSSSAQTRGRFATMG